MIRATRRPLPFPPPVEGLARLFLILGVFVSIEGVDGSGKSTQAGMLEQHLLALGREVVATREPGGTELGEAVRRLVLNGPQMAGWAEAALFAASRAEHATEVIGPALERSADVICDRFVDSSLAYQGIARGLGLDAVLQLNLTVLEGLLPDRTVRARARRRRRRVRRRARRPRPDRARGRCLPGPRRGPATPTRRLARATVLRPHRAAGRLPSCGGDRRADSRAAWRGSSGVRGPDRAGSGEAAPWRLPCGEGPAHAYLFHGPAGVGKRRAAFAFAGELLRDGDRVSPAGPSRSVRAGAPRRPDQDRRRPRAAAALFTCARSSATVACTSSSTHTC